jgi:hypothetical protein
MPNVFDVDAATKCVTEVGRLTTELAGLDEKRKGVKSALKAKQKEMKTLLSGPRKAKKSVSAVHAAAATK